MKGNDKPFEGCLFWHTIGFVIENNIKHPTGGSLHFKVNKRFSADLDIADLDTAVSKENIEEAKNQIIFELAKEVELAFKDYLLAIEQK